MSENGEKWQAVSELVLYRSTDSAVLLLSTSAGWVLPEVKLTERVWIRPESVLNEWVMTQLHMRAITLYCAWLNVDRTAHREETVFVMEVTEEAGVENGRFFTLDELLLLPPFEHCDLVETCLVELRGSPPAQRPPWLHPGWFDEAAAWMREQLAGLGYVIQGDIEQINNWVLSSVLRVATDRGYVYLKAVVDMPLFVNEPVMVQALAQLLPGNLPHPLAIEPVKRWMLMSDFGKPIGRNAPLETLAEMVQEFGRIQVRLSYQVDTLWQIGCLDRRLVRLAEQLTGLLADERALQGMETAEIDNLHRHIPHWQAAMAELATYHIPPTLMHGDLHLDNAALREGQMLFFDWTDACVTHPFMDMMVIYEEPDESRRTHLRDVYLQQWTAFEPMERLLQVWRLVGSLWPLHQAVSYQLIMANLEEVPRQGFGKVIPYYLNLAAQLQK